MNSFQEMKRSELDKVADEFAVDISDVSNKAQLIERLEDEGVTFEEWQRMQQIAENDMESPDPEVQDDSVEEKSTETNKKDEETYLVKMERENPSFDAVGKTFTRDHPFMVCTKKEVDELMYNYTGFRMASPAEVEEYYS